MKKKPDGGDPEVDGTPESNITEFVMLESNETILQNSRAGLQKVITH